MVLAEEKAFPAKLAASLAWPARARFIPPFLRAAYALALKRTWRAFSSARIWVDVPRAGQMALQPWEFLDSRLYFFGVWEPSITQVMLQSLQPGGVAIDIGGMEAPVLRDLLGQLRRKRDHAVTIVAEVRHSTEICAILKEYVEAGFQMYLLENNYRMWRYASSETAPPRPVEWLASGQHDIALVRRA